MDFVVKADQTSGVYKMKFRLINCHESFDSLVKLVYSENSNEPMTQFAKKRSENKEDLPLLLVIN